MKSSKTTSKDVILRYGVILGGLGILLNLIMYATGMLLKPNWYFGGISIILFIVVIVFGIKNFKQTNESFLSFTEAIKVGVGIAIIAALISVLYNYIFTTFIDPDFTRKAMEVANQKLSDQGLTDDQIKMANKMTKVFSSPFIKAALGIVMAAVGGFVVSAITGGILQKRKEVQ